MDPSGSGWAGGRQRFHWAYPRIGFTQGAESSIDEICAADPKVLAS